MRTAGTGQLLATFDSYPCFLGGFYPSDGWVGGMGRLGMISPHGFAPFRLGIWTGPSQLGIWSGPFPVGDMDWPLSLT